MFEGTFSDVTALIVSLSLFLFLLFCFVFCVSLL